MWQLQDYRYARSPAEAVALMRQSPGRGRYIAGGTDLLQVQPADCDFVVDISDAGLGEINTSLSGGLFLGAAVTLHQLTVSDLVAGFASGAVGRAALACGNRPVRSVGTLGGNLCHASPAADMAPVLLALEAVVHCTDGQVTEKLPLTQFFLGPGNTILDDRLLVGIELPSTVANSRTDLHKLTRTAEDISLVQIAVSLSLSGPTIQTARVALGAVAPVPLRVAGAEHELAGLDLTDSAAAVTWEKAARLAASAASPRDDHRASAAYRRSMVEVLTRRLLAQLAAYPEDTV